MLGMPKSAPSRANKKQIMAHLGPDLVEAAHKRCESENITLQEIIGSAINAAVAKYGRKPFLKVERERLVRRTKSVAKVQTLGKGVRDGKRRIGAWYDRDDVEKVKELAREFGVRVEALVDMGLKLLLADELKGLNLTKQPEQAGDWDWSTAQGAGEDTKIPKKVRTRKAA